MLKEPEDIQDPATNYPDLAEVRPSVVLISPDYAQHRNLKRALESQRATVLLDMNVYPSYAHLPSILEADCDAFLIEIDSDPDMAMELVETICNRKANVTVMVYSSAHSPESMVRSMRAGAREFLSGNFSPAAMQEALVRAAVRRSEQTLKRVNGKLAVFWGAKGGSGVTTLAANFAIALRMETGAEIALLDLNPRLGDIAVLLGMTPRFTVTEALQNGKRLDQEFVSTLITPHSSGVSVLAAPDDYRSSVEIESRTVGKLVDVIRNQYPYVVVDAGRDLGGATETLFQMASSIYVVTELDVPSLRNAQRFISHIQRTSECQVEVVINRFDARRTEFDDERVSKALGLKPKWKVPSDYPAALRSCNTGSPLIMEKSPVSAALRGMARNACGKPAATESRKRNWSLFG